MMRPQQSHLSNICQLRSKEEFLVLDLSMIGFFPLLEFLILTELLYLLELLLCLLVDLLIDDALQSLLATNLTGTT